jgi:hypothetical protein
MTKAIDSPFADTLLGIFLGLSIKNAFDHSLSGLEAFSNARQCFYFVMHNRALFFLRLFQIVVFLLMLTRFYLGAYRYSKVAPPQTMPEAFIDTTGVLLLFAGFYLASLVVRNTDLFYWAIVAFLIVDVIWFFTAGRIRDLEKTVSRVTILWILFDALTIATVFFSMLLCSDYSAEWIALSAICLVSLWDLWWLRHFYAGSPDWAQRTTCIKQFVTHA